MPTDGTLVELERLGKSIEKLRVLKTKQNFGGPAGPRNVGLKNAIGDFVAFIDSDDLWHPNLLEIYCKYVFCGYSLISSTKFSFKNSYSFFSTFKNNPRLFTQPQLNCRKITYSDLLNSNLIVNSSVLVARNTILLVKFDERKRLVAVEDFVAWCHIHRMHGASLQLDLRMVGYRLHSNSLSAKNLECSKNN